MKIILNTVDGKVTADIYDDYGKLIESYNESSTNNDLLKIGKILESSVISNIEQVTRDLFIFHLEA